MSADKHISSKPKWRTFASTADLSVVLCLSIFALGLSAWGISQFNDKLYSSLDIYFQADTPRVVANMTRINSNHRRTEVHPIFSLLTLPITKCLIFLGVTPLSAAKAIIVFAAGLSITLFYIMLRLAALPIFAAALFAGVFLSSATFIYWFSVVETYAFSALSICAMLTILFREKPTPLIAWVLASAATLAFTVTNWMLGLAAAFFRLPFRKFVAVSVFALLLVGLLSLTQKALLPSSRLFFLPESLIGESKWTQIAQQNRGRGEWDPTDNLKSFFVYSAVAPSHQPAIRPPGGVTNRGLSWRNLEPVRVTILLWLILLLAGIWGIVANRKFWLVGGGLAAFITGQALLHSVYGDVTFLYAAHFFPALLAVAACAYFAPGRRLWLAIAFLFFILNLDGNLRRFNSVVHAVNANWTP